jgi:4-hydroxy-3-methylbut-2-enyl diphosphate reductase
MALSTPDRLVIVTALRSERAALLGTTAEVSIVRCGMGLDAAQRWADTMAGQQLGALAVLGVAGGLQPDIDPGDVIVASEVRDRHGRHVLRGAAPLVARLRAMGLRVHSGPVVSQPRIAGSADRARLRRTGALAVDMESAWLAESAGGRPLAVMRVVVDGAGRRLTDPRIAIDGVRALRSLRRCSSVLAEWSES